MSRNQTHSIYSFHSFSICQYRQYNDRHHTEGTSGEDTVLYKHYHVNGSYFTVKTLILQIIAAGTQRGGDASGTQVLLRDTVPAFCRLHQRHTAEELPFVLLDTMHSSMKLPHVACVTDTCVYEYE